MEVILFWFALPATVYLGLFSITMSWWEKQASTLWLPEKTLYIPPKSHGKYRTACPSPKQLGMSLPARTSPGKSQNVSSAPGTVIRRT